MTKFWSNVDDKEFFLLLNRFLKLPILRTIQVTTHELKLWRYILVYILLKIAGTHFIN